jgi:hypothetical protein
VACRSQCGITFALARDPMPDSLALVDLTLGFAASTEEHPERFDLGESVRKKQGSRRSRGLRFVRVLGGSYRPRLAPKSVLLLEKQDGTDEGVLCVLVRAADEPHRLKVSEFPFEILVMATTKKKVREWR